MKLVKKMIEVDDEQLKRIRNALKVRSDKDAINYVIRQFDTDIQIAEATLKDAGTFHFEEI